MLNVEPPLVFEFMRNYEMEHFNKIFSIIPIYIYKQIQPTLYPKSRLPSEVMI